ncbi:AAA family ATPase [Mycetocola zhujimingii]|uniref:HTH luxR-type domain-containing protein n=1 Tax=Mycetocola zhujimingii TaxID=2079792 RepID=A0A2U1TBT1_9MICO|nr:AAA family ATPase [Mycetocola zhujimingii]PWC06336.1 hypothetical protein DF223_12075 [Mycetocola zhujimingii]
MSDVRPDRAKLPTPPVLFGRARQLDAIVGTAATVEGGAKFVLIEGESGFGKTALLRAALAALPDWPRRHAVADAHERTLPYGVLNQLLATLDQSVLPPVLAGGVEQDVSALVAGAALLAVVDASVGPAIITIDDVQWTDEQSARALWFAARRSLHDRLLVIVAARPVATDLLDQLRRFALDGESGIRVGVDGLSPDHVIDFVRTVLDVSLPRRTAKRLVAATDGNPLHIRAILDRVAGAPDVIVELERRLGDGALALAPGFDSITREAMERMSVAARRVVHLVATLEDSVSASLVMAAASHLGAPSVSMGAIDEAIFSGMIDAVEGDGPLGLRLHHQRVGDAVLAELSERSRQELHHAAAMVVGGDRGLRHRVRAAPGPDEALARTLDAAAEEALRNHEAARAVRYLRWGSSVSGSLAARHERLVRAGISAIATQHFNLLVPAMSEFSNLPAGPERDLFVGSALYAVGDISSARTMLSRAALCRPVTLRERALVALANGSIAYLEIEARRFELVCQASDAVISEVGRTRAALVDAPESIGGLDLDDLEGIALTWQTLARWRTGVEEPVDTEISEHISQGEQSGFEPRHALMLVIRGGIRRQQGRLDEAIQDLELGIRLTDAINPALAPFGRIELALAQFRQGRWDDAATTAAVAVSLADDFGGSWTYGSCHVVATLVPAARGELESAEILIPEADLSRPAVDTALTMLVEAVAARARGDRAAVVRIARQALATEHPRAQVERGWWLELAQEAAVPSRPSPPPKDPLSVLSGREREVAHLAAQGLTNREVAQRLFVTVKGVEYHMGNVLAKLHLTSRRGIRNLIDGEQNPPATQAEKSLTRDAP